MKKWDSMKTTSGTKEHAETQVSTAADQMNMRVHTEVRIKV